MISIVESEIGKAFFRKDLLSIDEFISEYGNYGIYHPTLYLKWTYYDTNAEVEISKEEYNTDPDYYQKWLNYNDVLDLFNIDLFWNKTKAIYVEKVNEFKFLCFDYIDNFSDPNLKAIIIKDLIKYINEVKEALEEIIKPNAIRHEVINYFIDLYSDLTEKILERYGKAYPEIFQEETESKGTKKSSSNPCQRIFVGDTDKHFEIFKRLLYEFKIEDKKLYDFSYIYRRMLLDGYIDENVGEGEIRKFLDSNFHITINKLKSFEKVNTGNRSVKYSQVLEQFK